MLLQLCKEFGEALEAAAVYAEGADNKLDNFHLNWGKFKHYQALALKRSGSFMEAQESYYAALRLYWQASGQISTDTLGCMATMYVNWQCIQTGDACTQTYSAATLQVLMLK